VRFDLAPARRAELEPNLRELEQWVRQLEELDLEEYDPLLVPAAEERPRDE
jgi:hypothetical protein